MNTSSTLPATSRVEQMPEFEQTWARVCQFASQCQKNEWVIRTLERGVRNSITSVQENCIHRRSDSGTTGNAPVLRQHIKELWEDLRESSQSKASGALVFARALLCAALPDLIVAHNGTLFLKKKPSEDSTTTFINRVLSQHKECMRRQSSADRDCLAENLVRLNITRHIEAKPEVLAKLEGGPWTVVQVEAQLAGPTCDRVDLVARNADGTFAMIDVTHSVGEDDDALYAQVAIHRAAAQVLWGGVDKNRVRGVLVAFEISGGIASRMEKLHGIESVVVPAS